MVGRPEPTDQERDVTRWVAMLVESRYGLVPGEPTHPVPNVDPITVDWTFEDAEPRFALEVTTLRDTFETPTSEHVEQFRAAIRRHGRKVGWPGWVLGIREETSLNAALAPMVTRLIDWMIAAHLDRLGPAGYVRDVPPDLLHRMGRRFMDDCEQARLNGVIQISRTSGDEVHLLQVEEWSDSRSLRRPLERTLRDKTDALRRAKACGYVTMLGVEVVREDAQVELRRARRAPGFPASLDHLWLLVRDHGNGDLARAYYARSDDLHLVAVWPDV